MGKASGKVTEVTRKQLRQIINKDASKDVSKENNVLREAIEIVFGDREATYDHPIIDFTGTAMMLTGYFRRYLKPGITFTPMDVPIIVTIIKLSRESHKHTADNIRDIAGYCLTQERVESFLDEHNLKANDLLGILAELQQGGIK